MDFCYRFTSNKAIMVSTVQDHKTVSYISIIIHENNFTTKIIPFAATIIVQLKKHWDIYIQKQYKPVLNSVTLVFIIVASISSFFNQNCCRIVPHIRFGSITTGELHTSCWLAVKTTIIRCRIFMNCTKASNHKTSLYSSLIKVFSVCARLHLCGCRMNDSCEIRKNYRWNESLYEQDAFI